MTRCLQGSCIRPLTCLSRNTYALGAQVAESLLEVIGDPASRRSVQTETPRLVVRASTTSPAR